VVATVPYAPFVTPAFNLVQTGVVTGVRKIRRWLSPTILIAGQNSSGKTTLRDFFAGSDLPDRALLNDETLYFDSRLVDLTFKRENGPERSFCCWIRDSRGFFDGDPLAKDIDHTRPIFIYFVFDVRRIADEARPLGLHSVEKDLMKYYWVQEWVEKFAGRAQENIPRSSKAKAKLCGACVLVNKCDLLNENELASKKHSFDEFVLPHFARMEPLLGFGQTRFEVFYTTMLKENKVLRPGREDSDLPNAISFMFRMLSNRGWT
jgi:hypothetical protein